MPRVTRVNITSRAARRANASLLHSSFPHNAYAYARAHQMIVMTTITTRCRAPGVTSCDSALCRVPRRIAVIYPPRGAHLRTVATRDCLSPAAAHLISAQHRARSLHCVCCASCASTSSRSSNIANACIFNDTHGYASAQHRAAA